MEREKERKEQLRRRFKQLAEIRRLKEKEILDSVLASRSGSEVNLADLREEKRREGTAHRLRWAVI